MTNTRTCQGGNNPTLDGRRIAMKFVDKVNLVIACDNMIDKYKKFKAEWEVDSNRRRYIVDGGEEYYYFVLKTIDKWIEEYTELHEKLSKERCEI